MYESQQPGTLPYVMADWTDSASAPQMWQGTGGGYKSNGTSLLYTASAVNYADRPSKLSTPTISLTTVNGALAARLVVRKEEILLLKHLHLFVNGHLVRAFSPSIYSYDNVFDARIFCIQILVLIQLHVRHILTHLRCKILKLHLHSHCQS